LNAVNTIDYPQAFTMYQDRGERFFRLGESMDMLFVHVPARRVALAETADG
jgi:hypothetical protein